MMRLACITACIFILTGCVEPKKEIVNTALCGNGTVDPGEQCDDGNTLSHDGCNELCQIEPFCGNGVVEPGEECDDGNIVSDDGCSRNCTIETGCGNGILELGEECDDDNIDSGDGCDGDCRMENTLAVCGNGIHEYTEGCDDGNTTDGDGCSSTCMMETGCGDGVITPPEQCDDGNGINGDGCSRDCFIEFACGDGNCSVEVGETCEHCPSDCCPDCGNNQLDDGETCDDGNNTSGDGCSRGCTDEDNTSVCGNGLLEIGEECDDGNQIPHDGCSPSCVNEYVCGDQSCDVAEGESCQVCQIDCCPACGNGLLQQGEFCDTNEFNGRTCADFGYTGGNIACTDWCTFDFDGCTGPGPLCGNGTKEYGEECDLEDMNGATCQSLGFTAGLAFCGANCQYNVSGCSNRVWYFNETFDDVLPPTGWSINYPFEWGTPTTAGPASAQSGSGCLGTIIHGFAPDNSNMNQAYVVTPPIDLGGATSPVLYFWAYMDFETDSYYYDEWKVEYSLNGVTWQPLSSMDPSYNGTGAYEMFSGANQWSPYIGNIQTLAGNSAVQFRFSAAFDHYYDVAGLYLDNVMVVEGAQIPVTFSTPGNLGYASTSNPYSRELQVWGGSGDFTFSHGGTLPSFLSLDVSTGTISGNPTTTNVGSYNFTINVVDNQNPTNSTSRSFDLEVLESALFEDFVSASTPAGWSVSGSCWEIGTPAGGGPSSCHSAPYCVGTNMTSDYDTYCEFTSDCVTTTSINLTAATSALLRFFVWMDSESGYDGTILQIQQGSGTWSTVNPTLPAYQDDCEGTPCWTGQNTTWTPYEVSLTPYVGNSIRARWCFHSDDIIEYSGMFIDDVIVLTN
ncbi:DUF4215 domain-containing protein [Myxococcota bacterium]|nr:DUF4215 domain-containing protein [Myxococcota bacterium]MBU1534626.1 DUF4215 domain-containing protein [Myxococcota bacterium]